MKNFLLFPAAVVPVGVPIWYSSDDLGVYDYLADYIANAAVGDFARAQEGTYLCVGKEFVIPDIATDPEIPQP
jgi:hypothetical protein